MQGLGLPKACCSLGQERGNGAGPKGGVTLAVPCPPLSLSEAGLASLASEMACSLQGHIPLVAPSLHHRSRSADAQVRSVLPGARQGGGQGLPAGSCTQCWGLANPTPCATMTQRVPEWRAGGTSSRPGGCSVPLAPGLCWHCVPGPWWGLQAGAHGAPPPPHTQEPPETPPPNPTPPPRAPAGPCSQGGGHVPAALGE